MDVLLAAFTYIPQQRWGPVSPHGIGTALGFFLGAWLMAKRAEPRGIPRTEVYNAVTWGAFGAIIGARGFYVLGHLSNFQSITDALKVWEGGLTMFGGFIGGLVLGLGYLWRRKFDIPTAMDAAAPGFVVGVLIGRLGDIIIADHLGERTNLFFGYLIPNAELAPGYGPPYYTPGVVVHHTAVYDFIGALFLLGFLRWLEKRNPRTGTLFAAFSIWYGLQRFIVDFTRNRAIIESSYFGLSGSQWAGLAFAVFGVYLLVRMRSRASAAPAAVPAPVATTPEGASEPVGDTPPIRPQPPVPVPPSSERPGVGPAPVSTPPESMPPAPAPPVSAPTPSSEPSVPEPAAPAAPAPQAPPATVPPPPVAPPSGPPPVSPPARPDQPAYEPPAPVPPAPSAPSAPSAPAGPPDPSPEPSTSDDDPNEDEWPGPPPPPSSS
jgi:prolipoprotein diacylglyceryl transferase